MNRRAWLAAGIASLWTPVGVLLLRTASFRADAVLEDFGPWTITGMVALVGLLLGCGAMLAVGLPLHALLRATRATSWAAYLLCAALAGVGLRCLGLAGSWLSVALPAGRSPAYVGRAVLGTIAGQPTLLLWPGLLGLLTGVTFWWIARPDRPTASAAIPRIG